MLDAAIQKLFDKAEQAVAPKPPALWRVPQEPDYVYFVGDERHEAAVAPRNHLASDLSAIITFATDDEHKARVWYDRSAVICHINDAERRDKITLWLISSPQMQTLASWESSPPVFAHRKLILELRTRFHDCLDRAPGLLDTLRSLRFKAGVDSQVQVGAGRQSMSTEQLAEVSNAQGQVPDLFYLEVPIWLGPLAHIKATIGIGLECDPATQNFTLHPLIGMIEQQVVLGEAAIGELLRNDIDEDRLRYGRPEAGK